MWIKCSQCGINDRTTYSHLCKKCHANKLKFWYRKNKEYVSKWRRKRAVDTRKIINKLKDFPCVDCNNLYPGYVMDFDHVKGKKLFGIATSGGGRSQKSVIAEIEKCDLVCSN